MVWWLKGMSCICTTSWNFQQYHGQSTCPPPVDGSVFMQLDWYFNLLTSLCSKYLCGSLYGKTWQKYCYKQGSYLPVLIFLSPSTAAVGAVELPRAPSMTKIEIVEVGERLWSSLQTGWLAQPRSQFSGGKVLQLLWHLRNLPRPLSFKKSRVEYLDRFTAGAAASRQPAWSCKH